MILQEFFEENPQTAIAFSGGVDSAYLLYAAVTYGKKVKAYYVKTPFQPLFELEDACRLAEMLHADMQIIHLDVLQSQAVTKNPADRCYHCKKLLFGNLAKAAAADGFTVLIDGTNASDQVSDRPGMRALAEMHVRSPLRECGLTKDEIRKKSKEAGLFTWDKPAYACLATRIPTGQPITAENLQRTERAEAFLSELGFRDFRVRAMGDVAKLQLSAQDMERLLSCRERVLAHLKQDYQSVLLDLEDRHEQ